MIVDVESLRAGGGEVVQRVLQVERGKTVGVDHHHDGRTVHRDQSLDGPEALRLVGELLVGGAALT